MGCHTWFYTPAIQQPSYEEVRSKLIKSYLDQISLYERHINNDLNEDELFLITCESHDKSKQNIAILERIVRRLKGGYCQLATLNRYKFISEYDFSFRTKKFYIEVNFHDIFRVNNYPNIELLSLQETYQFIAQNQITDYSGKWKPLLIQFWNDYPEGRITFG